MSNSFQLAAGAPPEEWADGLAATGEATQNTERAQQALAGCASGELDALYDLHALCAPAVVAYLRRWVPTGEAQDVAQETFLYAWRRADRYDPKKGSPMTWLWQIARSRAIDHLRKAGRRQQLHAGFGREMTTAIEPSGPPATLRTERRRSLRDALQRLPKTQRDPVVLAYFQGMTQLEIADYLEVPLGTVKSRTSGALRALHEQLAPAATALL